MISFRHFNGAGTNIVLLHGLFGMGTNLSRLARALSSKFSVYIVDLPDHGGSSWLPSRDISTYSEIIIDWMGQVNIHSCYLLGHSLGGKVAMQIASVNPSAIKSLVVVDILPISYPDRHTHIFKAMNEVVASGCTTRKDAHTVMSRYISELEVIQFLSMSLHVGENGKMAWKLNHEGLARDYRSLCLGLDFCEVAFHGPTMFIKGGSSSYIPFGSESFIRKIFPKSKLETIPEAGHWIHADNPVAFNSIVTDFFLAAESVRD